MPYLICYDITGNKLRLKLSKKLKKAGLVRIQKSVFLGNISSTKMITLEKKISTLLTGKKSSKDAVVILNINKKALENIIMIGVVFNPKLVFSLEEYLIL